MTSHRRQHTHAHAATRSGAYFITACTQDRRCLFGDISDGVMHLNALGEIVQATWLQPPPRQPQGLSRGALVVMPNHIHAIVRIQASTAAPVCLRDEIRAFKSLVTQRINIVLDTPG
ncbi:transposase, partial [Leptothrix ochracea]